MQLCYFVLLSLYEWFFLCMFVVDAAFETFGVLCFFLQKGIAMSFNDYLLEHWPILFAAPNKKSIVSHLYSKIGVSDDSDIK